MRFLLLFSLIFLTASLAFCGAEEFEAKVLALNRAGSGFTSRVVEHPLAQETYDEVYRGFTEGTNCIARGVFRVYRETQTPFPISSRQYSELWRLATSENFEIRNDVLFVLEIDLKLGLTKMPRGWARQALELELDSGLRKFVLLDFLAERIRSGAWRLNAKQATKLLDLALGEEPWLRVRRGRIRTLLLEQMRRGLLSDALVQKLLEQVVARENAFRIFNRPHDAEGNRIFYSSERARSNESIAELLGHFVLAGPEGTEAKVMAMFEKVGNPNAMSRREEFRELLVRMRGAQLKSRDCGLTR